LLTCCIAASAENPTQPDGANNNTAAEHDAADAEGGFIDGECEPPMEVCVFLLLIIYQNQLWGKKYMYYKNMTWLLYTAFLLLRMDGFAVWISLWLCFHLMQLFSNIEWKNVLA